MKKRPASKSPPSTPKTPATRVSHGEVGLLRWMVGLMATLLLTFIGFGVGAIGWGMSVNRELGGIGENLKGQTDIKNELTSVKRKLDRLEDDIAWFRAFGNSTRKKKSGQKQ